MADHHRRRRRGGHAPRRAPANGDYLAQIELHPDRQGRGIGSRLIRSLLHQARQQGRDFTLDVLVVNQRAQALYRRLGLP
jgi:ribosomal protein S18 acetylase RimI-like enzyme